MDNSSADRVTESAVVGAPTDTQAALRAVSLEREMPVVTSGMLALPDDIRSDGLRRRVTYLVLFRLTLITLVLSLTLWLLWLAEADPWAPNGLAMISIIVVTYALTIVYAFALRKTGDPRRLATFQVTADLLTTALLVHITGGAQSAYTFFFPLSIIAASATHFRRGAVLAAIAATLVFSIVSVLGWQAIFPTLEGQRLDPTLLTPVEFGRAVTLNIGAFIGVAVLAYNLGGQIQQTSASLHTQRLRAANLQVLHQDIVRSLSSGLITVDGDDEVLTANEAACQILGQAQEAVVGAQLSRVLPEVTQMIRELDDGEMFQRATVEAELSQIGTRTLGITISPLRHSLGRINGRIINFQDLTEIRKMEEQVRKTERMALLGTLAAGVAHEIRNPLTAISGSVQLLAANPDTDDDSRALMTIVTREAERLNGLIAEMLDYANPRSRTVVPFEITTMVDETITVFSQDRTHSGIQVQITKDSDAGPVHLEGDPSRLRQVLWNLIRNAAEAAESTVSVQVYRSDDHVRIRICDDGPGIAPEHLDKVFDPFFTTKDKGTGLGLATCHSIITEQNGTIQVRNSPGAGCCFSVSLPLST